MKKIIITLIIVLTTCTGLLAQQFPTYTQFTLNKFLINPAVTGVDGFTTASLIAKEQWVGFRGTPRTHAVTIDSRILGDSYILKKLAVRKKEPQKTRSGNTSWGACFFSDLNGPVDKTGVNGSYGYHIEMGESQLSFGLSLLFFQLKIQDEQFVVADDRIDDPLITGNKQSIWITDANFGVYYTAADYYAGYSTVQLFNSSAQFGDKGDGKYRLNRQHNLMGGYRFDVASHIQLEPSVLLKLPESGITQFDINIKGTFDNKYWAGINYRTRAIFSVFGGLNYERYYFGYSFDFNLGDFMPNTYGSHEFIVTARFGDSARRYKWLNSY
ncbi:MAG: type IX secretion system membrane protein PorP/SprF [Bacteroidales bacterium]|nr:type IX secretion system membrane protein PorP/SprF [Bacteroidales bacterium]